VSVRVAERCACERSAATAAPRARAAAGAGRAGPALLRHDFGRISVGPPGGALEAEARDAAARASRGETAAVSLRTDAGVLQRDLATPEPTPPAPAQPDLTEAQIREAIRYNRERYDEASTRLIQNILGGPVTGAWTRDNVVAIAITQEQHGLHKDGKVGPDTFDFIVAEQEREGLDVEAAGCLTMFEVVAQPARHRATPGPNGTTVIQGHHLVTARFSERCDCSQFEYRQFVVGLAGVTRVNGDWVDEAHLFTHIPGGVLPDTFHEDGMTNCAPGVNYGHRLGQGTGQPATTANCGENQYRSLDGTPNQPAGCAYRGEDFPSIHIDGLSTGETTVFEIRFRGEIRRHGRPIATKQWTDVDEQVTTP
jgi:hypothetical protein